MSYPKVIIDLNKIEKNTLLLSKKCNEKGIDIAAVTKVFCGAPEIAHAMIKGGAKYLADSRIENLKKLNKFHIPKILLRLPMKSQAEDVVEYADISLNSEIEVIEELSTWAKKKNKVHNIILMIDLGDLREGIFEEEEIYETINKIKKYENIRVKGIGTNLTCYGGIIPRKENLNKLLNIRDKIKERNNLELEMISGGNSSSLHLIESDDMPQGINHLRLGESLVLGRETAFGENIENAHRDCFKLEVEIIEIKEKPSIPIGDIGMDAFGNKPTFIDKGIRKRALCAIGKQDVDISDIELYDCDIDILGGSSDHLILDITDTKNDYNIGDIISFRLSYGGILKTMTSEYVDKVVSS